MRDITPAAVMVERSPLIRPVVEITSWLGSQYLGEVPVVGGAAMTDLTVIGGALELQVPRAPEWVPTSPDHPLGNLGQELLVRKGWRGPTGDVLEWASIGRYMIRRSVREGEAITVHADGLGQRIEHDRFTNPFTVGAGQFLAQSRALMAGTGIPVVLHPSLENRDSWTRSWERGGSRVEAWEELLTAWGAVSYFDPDGRSLVVRAPYPTTGDPTVTFTDGVSGSVVDVAAGDGPEDGPPNGVVASSAPEDESVPVSATVTMQEGPRRWGGPYGRRPAFYSSPLLTNYEQVAKAAATRLHSLQAQTWDLTADVVSCPATQPGDLVRVISERDDTDVVGRVIETRIGLQPDDEPGQVAVQALRGVLGGVTL